VRQALLDILLSEAQPRQLAIHLMELPRVSQQPATPAALLVHLGLRRLGNVQRLAKGLLLCRVHPYRVVWSGAPAFVHPGLSERPATKVATPPHGLACVKRASCAWGYVRRTTSLASPFSFYRN